MNAHRLPDPIPQMKLYICFTGNGLVLAKAGIMEERHLLQHTAAIGYLGPMSPACTAEYLEKTYGECNMQFETLIAIFAASADTFREFQFARLHERKGSCGV
jgi:hypothetical protein